MFAIANGSIAMDNKNHVYITNKDMLTVTMIQAYDGRCFLVRTKNHVTLIDTADKSKTTREKLISTLKDNNITRINNLIVTSDLDHCTGNLDFLLNKTEENTTAYPWLKNIIVENIYYNGFKTIPSNVTRKTAYAGTVLNLGDDLYFVVLSPTKKIIDYAKSFVASGNQLKYTYDYEDLSIYGRLQYQSFSILFPNFEHYFDGGVSTEFTDYLTANNYTEYNKGIEMFIRNTYIIEETVSNNVFKYAPELKCTVLAISGAVFGYLAGDILEQTQATHVLCYSSENTLWPSKSFIQNIKTNAPYVLRSTCYISRCHGNVTLLSNGTDVLVSCENKNVNWLNEMNALWAEGQNAYEVLTW